MAPLVSRAQNLGTSAAFPSLGLLMAFCLRSSPSAAVRFEQGSGFFVLLF